MLTLIFLTIIFRFVAMPNQLSFFRISRQKLFTKRFYCSTHRYVSLTSIAVLPVGLSGPVAHTLVLIKPQAGRASVLLGKTINTGVKDVAHGGVRMGIEAVQAGANVIGALGGLCKERFVIIIVEGTLKRHSRSSLLSPHSTLK